MKPDLVAGLEVGDGGDGEGDAGAGDVYIDFGAFEIEARLGVGGREGEQQEQDSEAVGQDASRKAHRFQFRRLAEETLDGLWVEEGRIALNCESCRSYRQLA